jgi:plasmid stabilization system protein ParE
MRIRWTVAARSDLARLHEFLAPVNPAAAARMVRRLRAAPAQALADHPRLGVRLDQFTPREVRRLFVDDYEFRYEIQGDTLFVTNLWHTREDR